MDPSFYSLFAMGDDPSAMEQQKALAAAIRGQTAQDQQMAALGQARSAMGAISGHPALQQLGRQQAQYATQMNDNAMAQEKMLAQAGEHAAGAKGRALDRALRARELRERALDRQANKFIIIQGEDGGQYFVDPTNPRAKAIAVTDEAGASIRKAGKPTTKDMPASMIQDIADNDAALKQLDALEKESNDKAGGLLAGPMSMIPGTEASQYTDAAKLNAKVIGRGIEGGRMTDADAAQYQGLMPGTWDSDGRRTEKVRRLRESATIKRNELLRAAEAGGYDTSRFNTPAQDSPKQPVYVRGKLVGYIHADGTEEMVD